MEQATAYERELSPAQERFAQDHDAWDGMRAPGDNRGVFLYHDEPWGTRRWLVDDAGHTLDLKTFHKSFA
jgi:hypothetical protein